MFQTILFLSLGLELKFLIKGTAVSSPFPQAFNTGEDSVLTTSDSKEGKAIDNFLHVLWAPETPLEMVRL